MDLSLPSPAGVTEQPSTVAVRWFDGRPHLLVAGVALAELAGLLEQAHAQRVRRGLVPLPRVNQVVDAARHAWAVQQLVQSVPHAEHRLAQPSPASARWITTGEAAVVLGISERGVRQRIARGQLPAQRRGRDYVIDIGDLERSA